MKKMKLFSWLFLMMLGLSDTVQAANCACFYELDGSLGLTADFNAGNQALAQLKAVGAGTTCTGNSLAISDGSNGTPAGKVVSCQGGTWQAQGSLAWQDSVADFANLPTCDASIAWQTRIVQAPAVGVGARAYTCSGSSWQALAVDDSGNLSIASNATVGGNATISGNVTVGGNQTVTGNVSFSQAQVNSIVTAGSTCASPGLLARDTSGLVLSCQGSTWKAQGSLAWQDSVANFASLPTCTISSAWQTRIVQTPTTGSGPRAYTCNGTSWQALAIDDSGNLVITSNITVGGNATITGNATVSGNETVTGNVSFSQAQVNSVVTAGSACASTGLLARDTSGLMLSCQSSIWTALGGSTKYGNYTFKAPGDTYNQYYRGTGYYNSSSSTFSGYAICDPATHSANFCGWTQEIRFCGTVGGSVAHCLGDFTIGGTHQGTVIVDGLTVSNVTQNW